MRVLTHTNLAGGNSCWQGKVKSTTSFGLGCEFDNSKFCFKIAEKRKFLDFSIQDKTIMFVSEI